MRRLSLLLVLLSLVLPGCGNNGDSTSNTPTPTPEPTGDLTPPEILFTPITGAQLEGQPVEVRATIRDASGVASALLYYRLAGDDYWASAFLTETGPDTYSASIPDRFVQSPGVDYYLEAVDASYNRNRATAPETQGSYYHFDAIREAIPFPAVFDFEPTEASSSVSVEQVGWKSYVLGFNNYENWLLNGQQHVSGATAAYHDHGSPYQNGAFEDWLVSPPIDLSQATGVDLTFWEWLDLPDAADHSLMISLGSSDPESGDYVPVLDPLPVARGAENAWARSEHIDLSAWAGNPIVYLAFVYRGVWADDWYIDDVSLQEPAPDLQFGNPSIEPEEVSPGETAQVYFVAYNFGLAPSGTVTAELSSSDANVVLDPTLRTLEPIPVGESTIIGPFDVRVASDHTDNVFVPLTLTLTDGALVFSQATRVQVGRPPVAHIEVTHQFADDIQLFLGYGDPAAPSFYTVVSQDEGEDASGTFAWDVDISAFADALPPDNNTNRWFVEVWDDSVQNTGTLDVFEIRYGDEVYSSEGLPQNIPDDSSEIFAYLPGGASFSLRELSTDPVEVTPGAEVSLTFTLNNTAAQPHGLLMGTLVSSEPDVSGLYDGYVIFTYDAYAEPSGGLYGVATPFIPFTFQVSPEHQDGSPLDFTLILVDDVDQWEIPLKVAVPWPVLGGLGLTVEDSTSATPDQALTPGETAGLRIRVRNGGSRATYSGISGTITLLDDGGSASDVDALTVTFTNDSGTTGAIPAGGGGKSTSIIPVHVGSAALGTALRFKIHLTDGTLVWDEERTLYLGEVPWNPLTVFTDDAGDSSGDALDLASGEFWRQGTLLKLRWHAHAPFDIRETYLYSYLSSGANYQYALFVSDRLAFYRYSSSGTGYWYNSYVPASAAYSLPDTSTVELSLNLSDVGLSSASLYGGASTDACDGTTACDYAPNAASQNGNLTRFWW